MTILTLCDALLGLTSVQMCLIIALLFYKQVKIMSEIICVRSQEKRVYRNVCE